MVPFHMLHIVSYCAIVTLSLRQRWRFDDGAFIWSKKFSDMFSRFDTIPECDGHPASHPATQPRCRSYYAQRSGVEPKNGLRERERERERQRQRERERERTLYTNRWRLFGFETSETCFIVVYRHISWGGRKTFQNRRTLNISHNH